jgi:hypothetical protein
VFINVIDLKKSLMFPNIIFITIFVVQGGGALLNLQNSYNNQTYHTILKTWYFTHPPKLATTILL